MDRTEQGEAIRHDVAVRDLVREHLAGRHEENRDDCMACQLVRLRDAFDREVGTLTAERNQLQVELERARPIVDATKAWRETWNLDRSDLPGRADRTLIAAIDALVVDVNHNIAQTDQIGQTQ